MTSTPSSINTRSVYSLDRCVQQLIYDSRRPVGPFWCGPVDLFDRERAIYVLKYLIVKLKLS